MTIKDIYNEFIKAGMTPEGACGLMGNLEAESSGIRAANAEGWSDEADERYTAEVDTGKRNFIDYIGYGIAQWTWWDRKQKLLDFAKGKGVSVGDLAMQVEFCINELQTRYPKVWAVLTTTKDMLEATTIVCTDYEKPKVNNIETRYKYAQQFYSNYANEQANDQIESGNEQIEKTEEGATVMTANEAINKLVACAKAQVGYLEKRSNAQLDEAKTNAGTNNWNKYARDIDSKYPEFYNGKKNGYAWCDIFVDWCFITTFGYENALKLLCAPENSTGAGCIYSARFYRSKGQFYNSPKVGDQVFCGAVGNESHTGIVVAVDGNYITTVEGNTSGGSGVDANGDGVYQKRYNIKAQYIPGYGRPDWSIVANTVLPEQPVVKPEKEPETIPEKEDDDMCTVTLPMLRQGAENGYVVALQAMLIKRGFSVGIWGADGDFGNGTLKAVKNFQTKKKLEVDGIVGAQTWAALLKG